MPKSAFLAERDDAGGPGSVPGYALGGDLLSVKEAASFSKTQIDRLGDRLREGSRAESDLRMLDFYRRTFSAPYGAVVDGLRRLGLEPTGRPAKSTESLVEKLRRESVRLTQIQDVAGCRMVVESMVEQDQLVRQLRSLFPTATVVDRRVKPSYGYRAIHVIPNLAGKLVEIQVRSALQHLWAEFSEKLSDQVDQDLKYGGGPRELGELLLDVSTLVAGYEQLLKDTHDAKIRHVRELEEQEAKIKTMHQSLREVLSDAIQKSSGLRRSNS